MNTTEMKKNVRIWFQDIFAKRDFTYLDGPNHKGTTGPEFVRGKYNKLDNLLTNITVELQDLIAEGNKVVAHYKMNATHSGPFLGIDATNRDFIQEGMTVMEFDAKGKINYTYGVYDRQKIIQQLTQ
ncbi:MAG: ester cyclase [Candidatus Hodarchaeales archaeon]|jgi:hypothetical protein